MAKAIVEAATNYQDPDTVVRVSRGLGDAMRGLDSASQEMSFSERGW